MFDGSITSPQVSLTTRCAPMLNACVHDISMDEAIVFCASSAGNIRGTKALVERHRGSLRPEAA